MSAADSLYRSWGEFSVPLPIPTGDDAPSLVSLDPARDILLDLLKAAINAELTERWAHAYGGVPKDATAPVTDVHPGPPTSSLVRQRKTGWPVLFVYRTDEPATVDEFTIWQERITQKWGIDYILGPLDAGGERRLRDILIAVAKVIALTLRAGGHKAYATEESGQAQLVLGPGYAGFSEIKITDFRLGAASFASSAGDDGPRYHAMSMTLAATELESTNDGADPVYGGMSLALGTGNADGLIESLFEAVTE